MHKLPRYADETRRRGDLSTYEKKGKTWFNYWVFSYFWEKSATQLSANGRRHSR